MKSGEIEAVPKALFIFIMSLFFPFVSAVKSIYMAVIFVVFVFVGYIVSKKTPEKYMALFIFLLSLVWIVYGYVSMMVITGGA